MSALPSRYPPARLAWGIWGLGAAFYLIGFYQRVAPGVITHELMREFSIGAAALGNLSALYFYSYVAMQVPTGILADRLGPRRLLATGAGVAALGTLLFSVAPQVWLAGLGRLMVGGSVAVAYVGVLKLAAHWLAPRQYALSSGLALFIGVVGAVFAGVPLRLLVDGFGWRPVMGVSALVTAVVCLAIWWLVRDDPEEHGYRSHAVEYPEEGITSYGAVAGLRRVASYHNTWLLFLVPGGLVGPILTFAGLWGVPFLTTHYGLSATNAAAVCSALLIAWATGGPVLGVMSDYLGRRKPLYVAGSIIAACVWTIVVLSPPLPVPLLVGLLLVCGIASSCIVIGFAFARESVPPRLSGTVVGMINMGLMMGPMLLQPTVGWMLDRRWEGGMINGARVYELAAYRSGFLLMLSWTVLAAILITFTRETYCQPSRDQA